MSDIVKLAPQRAQDAVKQLRAASTALNLLATEMEVCGLATESFCLRWSNFMEAHAETVHDAAAKLRGEKP